MLEGITEKCAPTTPHVQIYGSTRQAMTPKWGVNSRVDPYVCWEAL